MMPTLEIMTVLEKTQSVLQQDKALIMEEADEVCLQGLELGF